MARLTLGEDRFGTEATAEEYRGLESGDILFFPVAPPLISAEDQAFLVTQKQLDTTIHKNISYRPANDRIKGIDRKDAAQAKRARDIMRAFSHQSTVFLSTFLNRYADAWKVDYASFRSIEEKGRKLSPHARNDLLHVDSFPGRPSHGDRILRLFINVHPERSRVWRTSDPFADLVPRFADRIGATRRPGLADGLKRGAVKLAAGMGLPVVDRPPYDALMLKMHHAMKEDADFQANCRKDRWEFPAGSAWIVFTDTASHACETGQHAMEQTFIISRSSLTNPEIAPISILERLAGRSLARTA